MPHSHRHAKADWSNGVTLAMLAVPPEASRDIPPRCDQPYRARFALSSIRDTHAPPPRARPAGAGQEPQDVENRLVQRVQRWGRQKESSTHTRTSFRCVQSDRPMCRSTAGLNDPTRSLTGADIAVIRRRYRLRGNAARAPRRLERAESSPNESSVRTALFEASTPAQSAGKANTQQGRAAALRARSCLRRSIGVRDPADRKVRHYDRLGSSAEHAGPSEAGPR
jgi:hypothetical protein